MAAQYDKCLEVDFPLDQSDDTALLNYVNGETTVLKGFLKNEPNATLSVTVEGDVLTVGILNLNDWWNM